MASLQTLHSRAQALDAQDPLAIYRQQFHIPRRPDGQPVIYLCGNSLGLQPVAAQAQVQQIMNDWATQAVSAYTHAPEPWMTYADSLKPLLMPLVGATAPEELAILNTLSVNLHLLLVSFYAPTATRFKIVVEDRAFPSDRYVVDSHLRTRGLDPADTLVVLRPAQGDVITPEDVARVLATEGDHVALWLLGGVNYYTGQWFDIPGITQQVQASGARIGWDLAHAVGNVPLALSEWGVDFAAWCHYKYVNGGPTCPGAIYIHPKHLAAGQLPRYEGWWGNHPQSRFLMRDTFEPAPGADAWVHSIPALLHLACMRAALALFAAAGMPALRQKSLALTALLEEGIGLLETDRISSITPKDPSQRGAQLSLRVAGADRSLFDRLSAAHVVADWREPDTIRVAPVPLYNSYADVAHFVQTIQECL